MTPPSPRFGPFSKNIQICGDSHPLRRRMYCTSSKKLNRSQSWLKQRSSSCQKEIAVCALLLSYSSFTPHLSSWPPLTTLFCNRCSRFSPQYRSETQKNSTAPSFFKGHPKSPCAFLTTFLGQKFQNAALSGFVLLRLNHAK